MNGDVKSRTALKAELENASLYVWPKEDSWAGIVDMKKESTMIQFVADSEDSAKVEALRIASASDAEWKAVGLISRW